MSKTVATMARKKKLPEEETLRGTRQQTVMLLLPIRFPCKLGILSNCTFTLFFLVKCTRFSG